MINPLKEKRKKLGFTQAQMAQTCGVSRRTYQTYEETKLHNNTYYQILNKLEDTIATDINKRLLNLKTIKREVNDVLINYVEVKCAYLYGSYANNTATGESDIDLLIVSDEMGLKFYQMASDLEKALQKKVDVKTINHIKNDKDLFMNNLLIEGIKIYTKAR